MLAKKVNTGNKMMLQKCLLNTNESNKGGKEEQKDKRHIKTNRKIACMNSVISINTLHIVNRLNTSIKMHRLSD